VGGAGRILDGILGEVGIRREDCYVTNVVKYRPKGNDFGRFYEDKKRSKRLPVLEEAIEELKVELMAVRPNVIVALGNEAMRALTEKTGVTSWRGSIMSSLVGKVLPTYHPAAILRQWSWRPVGVLDLTKAKEESAFPEVRRKPRTLHTTTNFEEVKALLAKVKQSSRIAFDIETERGEISSIAFASSSHEAVTIPFFFALSGPIWHPTEQEPILWELIKQILEGPAEKIAQNAQFDMSYLERKVGIHVQNLYMDTMIAAHCIYPELPKGLDFLCSVYTDQPYYKWMVKTKDMIEFFKYNGLDACVTWEVAEKLEREMKDFGVWEFYQKHSHALIEPLQDMLRRGIAIDLDIRDAAKKAYRDGIKEAQKQLDEFVGRPLNVNSPKQMKEYLYEELKLPIKYKGRKAKGYSKTVTSDEEAIKDLQRTNKNLPSLQLILDIREKKKILSTYLEVKLDEDKRIRTSYLITGTETGRLASRATPFGTGTNLQNIPKGIARRMFVPDPGKLFISADYSQAEARVVAYISGEDRLIDLFREGGDVHRKNASRIFRKPESDISKEERTLAKRIVHASNYGMGSVTFAKTAGVSTAEAKRLLNQYFATYPRIKLWHLKIEQELRRTRVLTTPLGRKRQFFNPWNKELIKEAYAYIPQSTVSDMLNMGLVELYKDIEECGLDVQMVLQVHDSIVLQAREKDIDSVITLLHTYLERAIKLNGKSMYIPIDISVGNNWDCMETIPRRKND